MSDSRSTWMPILQRLNALMLKGDDFRSELTEDAFSRGWCGHPAATEQDIREAEMRIGVTLPPSYRSFLLISNGWRPFNSFVERLLPVQEIDRFRFRDPECFRLMKNSHEYSLEMYGEHVISDDVYLGYETPAHNVAERFQYYGDSLLISEASESELVLLNPFVLSADGEWETIFSAHWIPGNRRFRSFRDYLEDVVRVEEELPVSRSTDRQTSDHMSYPPNLFQGDE